MQFLQRTLPAALVSRALGVALFSVGGVLVVIFLMGLVEDHSFIDLSFEVVSAFGTVGLSRGVTPDLTWIGKLLICATMLAGRVGPLTLALALVHRTSQGEGHYDTPEGRFAIG